MPADCRNTGERPWTNTAQSPTCRALEVLARMTYEEKLNFRGALPRLGLISGQGGRGGLTAPPAASGITAFPHGHLVASSWDKSLAARVGAARGDEYAGLATYFPLININRTWHWGRSADTYGEDPYLTGEMTVNEVKALQAHHVVTVLRHYLANNQEIDRQTLLEQIPERALHEIYLYPWQQAVERAQVAGVWCAYNGVNTALSCLNKDLFDILRGFGFDGLVLPEPVKDPVAAIKAGTDILAPNVIDANVKSGKLDAGVVDLIAYHILVPFFRVGVFDNPVAPLGVKVSTPEHRKLAEEVAEQGAVLLKNKGSVLPLARVRSLAIIGEDAGKNATLAMTSARVPMENPSLPVDAITARAGSAVKVTYVPGNPGLGPLPAMAGEFATSFYAGSDLSGTAVAERTDAGVDLEKFAPPPQLVPAGGRGRGNAPLVVWSGRWVTRFTPATAGRYRFSVAASGTARLFVNGKAIASIIKADIAITAIGGVDLEAGRPVEVKVEYLTEGRPSNLRLGMLAPDAEEMAKVQKAARESDVAVVFAGERDGEYYDRTSLALQGDMDSVIEAVAAVNPRTVVVLNTAGAVAMPWIDKVAGVIWAGHPAAFDGSAIAALLFGDANPSGRLVMTFPVNEQQGPATRPDEYPGDGKTVNFSEGLLVGYRWYDAKKQTPLFPFGFGLSYTTFKYADLKISGEVGGKREVSVRVTNTGAREGAEVVQLYLGAPAAAGEPPHQLKGFEKVWLKPGESKTVSMTLDHGSLAHWDEAGRGWKVAPGVYGVDVGASSRDIRLKGTFTVR